MSEIEALANLIIKLLEMKEARKFGAEIAKIQTLAASIQSEHVAIVERNLQLASENCDLHCTIAQMRNDQAVLQEKHRNEVEEFVDRHASSPMFWGAAQPSQLP